MEPDQDEKEKAARVQAEVERMKQLPAASVYAAHRLRVLNKMLHILSINPKVSDAISPSPSPTGSAPVTPLSEIFLSYLPCFKFWHPSLAAGQCSL